MSSNSLGEIIRSLRKQAGLSQEELADGICSPVSISRIENGTQMPSGNVLDEILGRLGTGTYQLCNIYYKNEKQLAFEKEAESVAKLISDGNIGETKKKLAALEHGAKDNSSNMQYFLLLDATVRLYDQAPPQEVFAILNRALSLSKPEFDFSDFRNVLLSVREANIINVIAAVLYKWS